MCAAPLHSEHFEHSTLSTSFASAVEVVVVVMLDVAVVVGEVVSEGGRVPSEQPKSNVTMAASSVTDSTRI